MSNAPVAKNVVKAAKSVVSEVSGKKPKVMGGTRLAQAQATEAASKTMQRRERATEAAETGRLRAARGRGRGYRSLMSSSRMEGQEGKGGKTTLGG